VRKEIASSGDYPTVSEFIPIMRKTLLKQRQHIFKGGNHLRIDFPQLGILFCHLPCVGCQLSKVAFEVRHNNLQAILPQTRLDWVQATNTSCPDFSFFARAMERNASWSA
jgi:hypothetical protein